MFYGSGRVSLDIHARAKALATPEATHIDEREITGSKPLNSICQWQWERPLTITVISSEGSLTDVVATG